MKNWELKRHLRSVVEDFDAMLYEAAELIAKSDVKQEDSVKLYSVLGHIAANVSVLNEIINKINE